MGLSSQSTDIPTIQDRFNIYAKSSNQSVIALAGNPNTGKSTIFNALTGLNQRTGNWPGKTVLKAQGSYTYENKNYLLVDLPGIYSLLANSTDEQVARDFLCFTKPDATIVVTDATCLERNLNLALQVLEITSKVIVCVNLIDEARRKAISIDTGTLAKELGVPVVPTAARSRQGLEELKKVLSDLIDGRIKTTPRKIKYDEKIEQAINAMEFKLKNFIPQDLNARWMALRLIDGDKTILEGIKNYLLYNLDNNIKKTALD